MKTYKRLAYIPKQAFKDKSYIPIELNYNIISLRQGLKNPEKRKKFWKVKHKWELCKLVYKRIWKNDWKLIDIVPLF